MQRGPAGYTNDNNKKATPVQEWPFYLVELTGIAPVSKEFYQ